MTEKQKQQYIDQNVRIKFHTMVIDQESTGWQIQPLSSHSGMGFPKLDFQPEISADWLMRATGLDALAFYLGTSLNRGDLVLGSQFDEALLDENKSYIEENTLTLGFSTHNLETTESFQSLSKAAIPLLARAVRHQTDGEKFPPASFSENGQDMSDALALVIKNKVTPAELYQWYITHDPYNLFSDLLNGGNEKDLPKAYVRLNKLLSQVETGQLKPKDVPTNFFNPTEETQSNSPIGQSRTLFPQLDTA